MTDASAAPAAPTTPPAAQPAAPTPAAQPSTPSPTPAAQPAAPSPAPAPPAPAPSPSPGAGGEFKVPDEFAPKKLDDGKVENAWAEKVKSLEDLWKLAANSQKMLGKKNLTPDFKNATPNEIEAYFAQIRPEKPEAYDFGIEKGQEMPELDKKLAQMLFDAGVSEHQANTKLIPQFKAMAGELQKNMFDPDAFIASMEEHFGRGYEVKTTQVREFVEGNMNDKLKEEWNNIPNQYLSVFYRFANNLMDNYGVSEGGPNSNKLEINNLPNVTETRKQLRQQIADLSKRPHTAAEKKALTDKLADTFRKK